MPEASRPIEASFSDLRMVRSAWSLSWPVPLLDGVDHAVEGLAEVPGVRVVVRIDLDPVVEAQGHLRRRVDDPLHAAWCRG